MRGRGGGGGGGLFKAKVEEEGGVVDCF